MEYTGNGIQNWILKEIELFIYYVKAPLRGLLKEIPENHLLSGINITLKHAEAFVNIE